MRAQRGRAVRPTTSATSGIWTGTSWRCFSSPNRVRMDTTLQPVETIAAELAAVAAQYTARHPMSAERHVYAKHHFPGGNTRSVLHYSPFPLTWAGGEGNRLRDID